jgi:NagD protein
MSEREIHAWLMDMDGVLVREEQPIPGASEFLARLQERGIPFLVLTNNSMYTRRDLAARLMASGLVVPEESIWTSALATARFLEDQRPGGTAFVIGEAGLTTALHQAGYTLTERNPDYVLLGETRTYSFERITRAIRLVDRGARFIATNPDVTGPSPDGPLPATGAVAALISRATGVAPYYVGKPNPLMIRSALARGQFRVHGDDRRPHGHQHLAGSRRGLNNPRAQRADGADRRRAPSLPPVANRAVGGGLDRRARLASARRARRAFTRLAARLTARSCLS